MLFYLKNFGCLFVVAIVLSGCATYHPRQLTRTAIAKTLAPPDMKSICVRRELIKHPLLKPVHFNYQNGLSPDEAAILGVIANPLLRAERDRKKISAAQVIQAAILPNPRLSSSLETPIGGVTQDKTNAFGLGLDWDISSLFTRHARIEATRAQAARIDLEIAWKEWQVAEAAKLHVYQLVTAKKRLTIARQMETGCLKLSQAIRRGVELGIKTAFDLANIQAKLLKARTEIILARTEIEKERLALNCTLGLPAEKSVVLEPNIRIPFLQKIPPQETLTKDIEKKRLDLIALRLGYESQEANVRAAISNQFPKISLGLSFARDSDRLNTTGVGVSIDLPIFNQNQGRIAVERAKRKQLFDEYAARLFEARSDIAGICQELVFTRQQITGIDRVLSDLKPKAHFCQRAAKEGRIDILNYYKLLNRIWTGRLERIKLVKKFGELEIALELASGSYSLGDKSSRPKPPEPVNKLEAPQ